MNNICYSFYIISLIWINFTLLIKGVSAYDDIKIRTLSSTQESSSTEFVPHRYVRYYFFFLASDNSSMTLSDFERILNQLNKWDEYCGGESISVEICFSSRRIIAGGRFQTFYNIIKSTCKGDQMQNECFNKSVVLGTTPGRNDPDDVGRMSGTLTGHSAIFFNWNDDIVITRQAILITNYVTDSLKNESIINELLKLKKNGNVTFISLNMAISDGNNVNDYFSGKVWDSYTNYLQWNPSSPEMNDTINPLCGYKMDNYTTPNPSYENELNISIYLFLSRDYINKTKLDLIELFSNLAARRWQYPCRQYRSIDSNIFVPAKDTSVDTFHYQSCFLENSNLGDRDYCTPKIEDWNWFSAWLDNITATDYADHISCGHYEKFFDAFRTSPNRMNKFLLITDVPMNCAGSAYNISDILKSYSDYASGAPLTVIAIDKDNDRSVYNSFIPLLPPTQVPNLYNVTNISDLLQNINKSIYFCLDYAPLLEVSTPLTPFNIEPLPYHPSHWYFYLIGALILISLVASVIIFIKIRNKKRQEKLQELAARMEMTAATNDPMERYEHNYSSPPRVVDMWEISLNSLNIDFIETLGKGAFAVVHMGKLHGRAPVLDIYPSLALQNYVDCAVAVKTLPAHFNETDIALFLSEIRLMKDIGYHLHLVSMLGCNCSIERPFLVLELADQSLLHWLIRNATYETDINLDKMLLSFSWQISDGMNYLSSKLFIHRDLAARNILLSKGSKAMVSDFGLCRKLDDATQVLTIPGGKLPLKWMALESLLEHQFSIKTDVWSFGVLMYEIYSLGQEPYGNISGEGLRNLLKERKRLEQPKLANEEIYSLMRGCWHVEPASRPDFAVIQRVLRGMLEDSTENYGYLQTTENEIG